MADALATLPRDPTASPQESEIDWEEYKHHRAPLFDRLRRSPEFLVGLGLLAAFIGAAVYALVHYGSGLTAIPLQPALLRPEYPAGPSPTYPFGVLWISEGDFWVSTDLLGALLRATPIDLGIFGGAIGGALFLGLYLGAVAGYTPGGVSAVIVDTAYTIVAIPPFVLVLVLYFGVGSFAPSEWSLPLFVLLFALVLWPYYAIAVRARAQQVAAEPYVEAARASGASPRQILFRHILPNSFSPVFAQVPIDVYNVLFVLSVFPFLGCTNPFFFGTPTPLPFLPFPEWGYLLGTGACFTNSDILLNYGYWWMYTFPALVVISFGLTMTLLCDGAERLVRYSTGSR